MTERGEKRLDKLAEIYVEVKSYDEMNPLQLSKKIEAYSRILRILGDYIAQSVYIHGEAYAKRKANYGHVLEHFEGTQKEKEGRAETTIFRLRLREAEAEAEMVKWKYAYISTQEQIQAMKKILDLLKYQGG